MNMKSLNKSIDDVFLFIRVMELNINVLKPTIKGGEPNFSKRKLYITTNNNINNHKEIKYFENLFKVVSLVDGKRNLAQISEYLNININQLIKLIDILINNKIITIK